MMLFLIIPLLSSVFFLLPKKLQPVFNIALTFIVAIFSSILAINCLSSGKNFLEILPLTFWGNYIEISVDALSSFFILIINFTVFTGACFALEYMQLYKERSKINFSIHYFSFFWLHYSMLLVCMLHQTVPFLVAWEIMSVASFMLVIFEHEKAVVLKAGINYLVQMHIGALFIIIACILAANYSGNYTWEGLSEYFKGNGNIFLFILFFIGFGIKAGFVPLHTWLPHAHPAAPSHVSGIMSGVMIKLGIYGILRVLLHIQSDMLAIGIFILVISAVSGIIGVSTAIIQHDMKKLLAYHSIENIGIIGIGIGTGMIGLGIGNNLIAILGFSGAMLHVLNHSLFKSLLFYSMGSVYIQTHTRNIEKLGGLIKKMPRTSLLFLLASIAICGLPPLNGFVSEFFIYNSFAQSLIAAPIGIKLLMLFAMISLVAIGGLAIFCFTKAFGISFLGTSRNTEVQQIQEAKWYSLLPQYLILLVIILIGVFPGIFIPLFLGPVNMFFQTPMLFPERIINITSDISIFSLVFLSIVLILYFLRKILTRNKIVESKPTWGCAYTGNPNKMQYTASSYSENYYHDMEKLLNQNADYIPIEPNDIFPVKRTFHLHSESITEEKYFSRGTGFMHKIFNRLAFIQSGKTQHYIMYMFVLLIILIMLTLFRII